MMNRPSPPILVRGFLAVLATGLLGGCASGQSPGGALAEGLGLGAEPKQVAADAFNVYDADKRRGSVVTIATGPHGEAEPYLRLYRTMVSDPAPTVQAAAARALGLHGAVADAPRLAKLLDHENAFVRWEAAKALQRIHNPQVTDALIDAAGEDQDPDVRIAAAKALGQYARPAVFDTLVGALRDTNYGVVQQAHASLQTMTGYRGPANATVWLNWAEDHRGDLFAHQQPYTYQPYDAPPTLCDRMAFWQEQAAPAPRRPRGLGPRGG